MDNDPIIKKIRKETPTEIYLQIDPEGDKPIGDYFDEGEVTWCAQRVNENDPKYTRQDWMDIKDSLPENNPQVGLEENGVGQKYTSRLEVYTKEGYVHLNRRMKDKLKEEWYWLVEGDTRTITHYKVFNSPA